MIYKRYLRFLSLFQQSVSLRILQLESPFFQANSSTTTNQLDSGMINFLIIGRTQVLSSKSRKRVLEDFFFLLEDPRAKQSTY